MKQPETALIVGAGSGLSASLARLFAKEGMRVALAARDSAPRLSASAPEKNPYRIANEEKNQVCTIRNWCGSAPAAAPRLYTKSGTP